MDTGIYGKPEVKRQLRRHRCRWEENIKLDLREEDWFHLPQNKNH
jgi:hypothetical protein